MNVKCCFKLGHLFLIILDAENFASEFSSGYLIGEVLCKHGLQVKCNLKKFS